MTDINKTELLAPAGTIECAKIAVNCGADAIYFAGKVFGARQNAGNFSDGEIFDISAKINETKEHYGAESIGEINIIQDVIVITVDDTKVYQGGDDVIPITIAIKTRSRFIDDVAITLPDGSVQFVHIVDGVGECTWSAPNDFPCDNYTVTVEYNSPGRYMASSGFGRVEVLKKLDIIIKADNQTGCSGSSITVPISIIDENGNSFTGNVTVTLPDNTMVIVEVINGIGNVTWNVPKDTSERNYPIIIEYYGNETTNPANFTSFIKIFIKKATKTKSNDITTKNGTTITIPISVYDKDGRPVTGKVIVSLPDGTTRVVKIVKGKGKVKWFVPSYYKGFYDVFISYKGNESLLPSDTTIKIKVIVKNKRKNDPKHHKHVRKHIPKTHKHVMTKGGIQLYKTGSPILVLSIILLFLFLLPLKRLRD